MTSTLPPLPPSPPSSTPTPPSPIGSPSSYSLPTTSTDLPSPTVSSPTVSPTTSPYSSPTTVTLTPAIPSSSYIAPVGSSSTSPDTTRYPIPTSTSTTPPTSRTTSTVYSSSVLTQTSTSVYQSTSTFSSDGQIYTTQVTVTTVFNPGATVIGSSTTTTEPSSASSNNTGAIVGGVIGGTAVVVILGLLAYFLFNKKRRLKDEFDGNFDPHAVAYSKHSPHPSFGGTAAVTNAAAHTGNGSLSRVNADEDDGMGGRIARGANGGGVISPYPFGSTPNQLLPPSHHPQMTQHDQGGGLPAGAMMAVGAGAGMTAAAAYNNQNPQQQGHHRNPSNLSSLSSGNYSASGPPVGAYFGMPGGPGYQGQPAQFAQYHQGQQYAQGQGHLQPTLSHSNTASSGGGQGSGNNQVYNPYAPPIGRGPSPGPSMGRSDTVSQSQYTSSSTGAGGSGGVLVGRTAKEIEAYGGNTLAGGGGAIMGMPLPHVVNPDDGPEGPIQSQASMPEPQPHPGPGYFGAQPASGAQNYYTGSSSAADPTQPTRSQSMKPGLITLAPSPSITSRPLVQHQDAGRVEPHEENPEAPSEIPPAYDSLPQDIRQ